MRTERDACDCFVRPHMVAGRCAQDDFIRARVTSVLGASRQPTGRITVRFEGMGQDGVEQTFDWPVQSARVISPAVHSLVTIALRRMMMSG